jgi:hypothetical protein
LSGKNFRPAGCAQVAQTFFSVDLFIEVATLCPMSLIPALGLAGEIDYASQRTDSTQYSRGTHMTMDSQHQQAWTSLDEGSP